MLLEDIGPGLDAAKRSAKKLLALESPKNQDYVSFESSLRALCEKALVGTLEFFSTDSVVSGFSMNHSLITKLLETKDKEEFRSLCKKALAGQAN